MHGIRNCKIMTYYISIYFLELFSQGEVKRRAATKAQTKTDGAWQ
jgi:hypothetical protein